MNGPELSIVVPSLNEAGNLPDVIGRLYDVCVGGGLNAEVIVSDDASEDETLQVAQELAERYPELDLRILHRYQPRRGYGAVVRFGLAHARGKYAAIVAADGQNPVELLPRMLAELRDGAHLVQCSRYSRQDHAEKVTTRFRVYQTLFRAAVRTLVGWDAPDYTYGFKAFDRVLALALGLTSNRFSLSAEITLKVYLSGGDVVFLPGGQKERISGETKFSLPRELFGHVWVVLRASLHRLGVLWF